LPPATTATQRGWRALAGRDDHGGVPPEPTIVLAAHAVPTGTAYTLLLLAHVASAVVGFGAVVVTAVQAAAAARGPAAPRAEAVLRYFRPGTNWAARALYGVPLFGFALIGVSHGAFTSGETFVVAGLGLWVVAIAVAEAVVWPAERRIQQMVARDWERAASAGALVRDCRAVVAGCAVLVAVFVVATVLMVGKP
jgi:hypothetical protein